MLDSCVGATAERRASWSCWLRCGIVRAVCNLGVAGEFARLHLSGYTMTLIGKYHDVRAAGASPSISCGATAAS